jgi:catechol 2,3-dioxygenase-like lactoylglutathione lyase family enzyme
VTRSPFDQQGLHDRLNRISHWDVNVSDRERSRAWYEATTALRVVAETAAAQPFPGLGIADGRFEGYLLRDATQAGGFPMLHLVEWMQPRPVGTPYRSHANVGWYRIVPQVPDIVAARAAVVAQGSEPFFPTTDVEITFHPDRPPQPYRVFAVHDPDGITVEFSTADGTVPMTPVVVAHNTADVERYLPFYVDTLGLDFRQSLQTAGAVPNVYSPLGGSTQLDGALLGTRGDTRVLFDWLEWDGSSQLATPYREANHLGIVRCAFEVDDIEPAREVLVQSQWAKTGTIVVGAVEEWDLGPDVGTRAVVDFTDPEGVGFQLVQQPPFPLARLHPYGTA